MMENLLFGNAQIPVSWDESTSIYTVSNETQTEVIKIFDFFPSIELTSNHLSSEAIAELPEPEDQQLKLTF